MKKRKIHYQMDWKNDWKKPSLVWRAIKHRYHRAKYGYDASYFWSLDATLVELILEFVKRGTEFGGYPACCSNEEEWHQVLREIQEGCEEYLDYENYYDYTKKKKWLKAKKLIMKYWEAFWI